MPPEIQIMPGKNLKVDVLCVSMILSLRQCQEFVQIPAKHRLKFIIAKT